MRSATQRTGIEIPVRIAGSVNETDGGCGEEIVTVGVPFASSVYNAIPAFDPATTASGENCPSPTRPKWDRLYEMQCARLRG